MNNKILIGLVIALGIIAIGETLYISSLFNFPFRDDPSLSYRDQMMMPAWVDNDVNNFDNWQPVQDMRRVYIDMQWSLARDFKSGYGVFSDQNVFYVPQISVRETPSSYILSADLPGMKKEDIKVDENGDVLTISGQRKSEEKTQNQKVFKEEQNYGYFARALTLPSDIKLGVVNTQYNKGVLEIILPRTFK